MGAPRVWKPLDVGGLRLYMVVVDVYQAIPGDASRYPKQRYELVVAAKSPRDAASLVEPLYPESTRRADEQWIIRGQAMTVYQPADWWTDGIPCIADWHGHETGIREPPAPPSGVDGADSIVT